MLRSPDFERRNAAALVLGELAPKETVVVEALGEILAEESPVLVAHALGALERIGSRAALPFLLPLLERREPTRSRAQRAIAALGEPAVVDVCRELAQSPRERSRPLVNLLVELDGKASLASVLEALLYEEPDFIEEVAARYQARWQRLTPEMRSERRDTLLHFLNKPDIRGRKLPTALALRLLGALADGSTRKTVAPFVRDKHPPEVRRAALQALRRIPLGDDKAGDAFQEFVSFLEEADLDNIVLPALEALKPLPTPPGTTAKLKELLDSEHPPVRRFAVERLGDVPEATAAQALVKILVSDDLTLRERAQDALRKSPASPPSLVKGLIAAASENDAWQFARLVAARANEYGTREERALADAAAAHVQKDDPRADALLHALRAVSPEAHRRLLQVRGKKFLQQKRFEDAVRTLGGLEGGAASDPEARYLLVVAMLKSSPRDPKTPKLGERTHSLLRSLMSESDFQLAQRLAKDRFLVPDDLFAIGADFAGGEAEERAFGTAILEKVVAATPRSVLGKRAREKLHSMRRKV
jgi:HEAT repeat protein